MARSTLAALGLAILALAATPRAEAGINVGAAGATQIDAALTNKFTLHMHYAAADYCQVGLLSNSWSCIGVCGGSTAGTKVLGKLTNTLRPLDYSGFVALEPDNATIVFAIAGTKSTSDILADAFLLPYKGVQSHFPNAPAGSFATTGFWAYFAGGVDSIQWHIDNTLPKYPWVKNVVFTGHSLGGIEMNLNAPYFYPKLAAKGIKLTTYAFAPARTVNDIFAKYLNAQPALAEGTFYRVIQKQDLIPHLVIDNAPFNFRHIGVEYFIDGSSSGNTSPIYKCPSGANPAENAHCSNSVSVLSTSIVPGHSDYFGIDFMACYILNYGIF